jgi:hypothetical protein
MCPINLTWAAPSRTMGTAIPSCGSWSAIGIVVPGSVTDTNIIWHPWLVALAINQRCAALVRGRVNHSLVSSPCPGPFYRFCRVSLALGVT